MKVRYKITLTLVITDDQAWNEQTTLETIHHDAKRLAGIKVSQILNGQPNITASDDIKVSLVIVDPDKT